MEHLSDFNFDDSESFDLLSVPVQAVILERLQYGEGSKNEVCQVHELLGITQGGVRTNITAARIRKNYKALRDSVIADCEKQLISMRRESHFSK